MHQKSGNSFIYCFLHGAAERVRWVSLSGQSQDEKQNLVLEKIIHFFVGRIGLIIRVGCAGPLSVIFGLGS